MKDISDHNNNKRESENRIARGKEASEETPKNVGVPDNAKTVDDDVGADVVEAPHGGSIDKEIEKLREQADYQGARRSSRKWWDAFEKENADRKWLIYRLLQELAIRKATIDEFFFALFYSGTDNVLGVLYYLDYSRLKKKPFEEARDDVSPSDDATSVDEEIKELRKQADYQGAGSDVRQWWDGFEKENANRKALIRKLLRELTIRKATIKEYFFAWINGGTDNVQAVLYYLEYSRLKNRGEK